MNQDTDNSTSRTGTLDLVGFAEGLANMPKALAQMGYTSLRKGQEKPIQHIMIGRDTLCILPTGTGKTACFAVPTIAMEWRTVVFSPLIALMADQVQSMNAKGIKTACINSAQEDFENYRALQEWSSGELQMLYVAPERIKNEQFRMAMKACPPSFVTADEAHCISSWSAAFRPSYCDIGPFIEEFNPKVCAAFTATATDNVIDDIRRVMHMENCVLDRYYPRRENLHLSAEYVAKADALPSKILDLLRTVKGSCIVYCQTVKEVAALTEYLRNAGESVTFYHGQIPNAGDKADNQDAFMSGRARICVATNAFGMGVDKPDIECIIHTGPPGSLEAVAQETGRAARDGREAICHMFYTDHSLHMQQYFFENSNPESVAVRMAWDVLQTFADGNSVAKVTGEELVEITGKKGAAAACNVLESSGCVERFKEEGSVYTVIITSSDTSGLPAAQQRLYDAILQHATRVGKSAENDDMYQIDSNYLASQLNVLPSTMRTKLMGLGKTPVAEVKPPFRGKCTRLLRPPTSADYAAIDERRAMEWEKLQAVRDYLHAEDKQQCLEDYFTLARHSAS